MSNVIRYLEELGRSGIHVHSLFTDIEAPMQQALMDRDAGLLRTLLDVPQQFYALVAPAEPEQPDRQPPQPDEAPAKPD